MKKTITEGGRIVLAHGETTGHCHEVLLADTSAVPGMEQAQYFEVDGHRELIVLEPCVLQHGTPGQPQTADHDPILLWPDGSAERRDRVTGIVVTPRVPGVPAPVRQGDVLLVPTGPGTWRQQQQREYTPEAIRNVAD